MIRIATDNLTDLIRKKHQILVQLREIGRKQQQLTGESQAANLLQLLGAKQHLITALQMVERNLRPFQTEDPDTRQWRCPEDRQQCAEQSTACQKLLAEVVEIEKQQEIRMTQRRNEVAAKLQQAGAAREAANAYSLHAAQSPSPSASRGFNSAEWNAESMPGSIDFTTGNPITGNPSTGGGQ